MALTLLILVLQLALVGGFIHGRVRCHTHLDLNATELELERSARRSYCIVGVQIAVRLRWKIVSRVTVGRIGENQMNGNVVAQLKFATVRIDEDVAQ